MALVSAMAVLMRADTYASQPIEVYQMLHCTALTVAVSVLP